MKYGFIKVAAPAIQVKVADCEHNANQILAEIQAAHKHGVELLVFHELCITGSTCGDLFWQSSLQFSAISALNTIIRANTGNMLCIVGLPIMHKGRLYNCAAVITAGTLIGIVPKCELVNNANSNEARHFASAPIENDSITVCGYTVPFSSKALFSCASFNNLSIGVTLGQGIVTMQNEIVMSRCGANVIVNLSCKAHTAGSFDESRSMVLAKSCELCAGYICSFAGEGESTTDHVYSGGKIIAENGTLLAFTPPFSRKTSCADIDVEKIAISRLKNSIAIGFDAAFINIPFILNIQNAMLESAVNKEPFFPINYDATRKAAFLDDIFTIQCHALAKRMSHISAKSAVIGVSGGLDSTLSLLVMVKTFTLLKLPLERLIAITMPCFGTSERTRSNALTLCKELGVTVKEIDISNTVNSHFTDIKHDDQDKDVTYENAQARMRTMLLFDIANKEGGLVVGTGDMSELALGWATFGGDHLSMYNVNASIPKTMIRNIVLRYSDTALPALAEVLQDIVATPVSPELLPADDSNNMQKTEDIIGPYELHDFFLYHVMAYGFTPSKICFLAKQAFQDTFSQDVILHWLSVFYSRFFASQFKRNCMTDGVQCMDISFSPRGGYVMPSDAAFDNWRKELQKLKEGV